MDIYNSIPCEIQKIVFDLLVDYHASEMNKIKAISGKYNSMSMILNKLKPVNHPEFTQYFYYSNR